VNYNIAGFDQLIIFIDSDVTVHKKANHSKGYFLGQKGTYFNIGLNGRNFSVGFLENCSVMFDLF
jgi:hypothetical protein